MNKKSVRNTVDQRTECPTESQEPYIVRVMDTIGLNEDKKICDGLGCFNYATHSIKEDGYNGTLKLCDDCITKFPRGVTSKSRKFNNRFPEQYVPTGRVRIDQSNSGRSEL